MAKKIQNIIDEIKKYFNSIESRINSLIIDEQTAHELFVEIDFQVKEYLIQLFGKEKETKDKGCFGNSISYLDDDNPYSDAAIYSYWTYRGESNTYEVEKETGEWRKNFFYKGNRWKNENLKANFYHFFKYFERISTGENPVEFFIELGVQSNKSNFSIRFSDGITNDASIRLPSISELKNLGNEKINKLIDLIESYRKTIVLEQTLFANEIKKDKNNEDNFIKTFLEARKNLIVLYPTETKSWINSVYTFFPKALSVREEDIVNIIFTLQYFDQPYDIHFFLPRENGIERKKIIAGLIITTKQGQGLLQEHQTCFQLNTYLNEIHHAILPHNSCLNPGLFFFQEFPIILIGILSDPPKRLQHNSLINHHYGILMQLILD